MGSEPLPWESDQFAEPSIKADSIPWFKDITKLKHYVGKRAYRSFKTEPDVVFNDAEAAEIKKIFQG